MAYKFSLFKNDGEVIFIDSLAKNYSKRVEELAKEAKLVYQGEYDSEKPIKELELAMEISQITNDGDNLDDIVEEIEDAVFHRIHSKPQFS